MEAGPTLTLDTKLERAADAVWRQIGEQTAVISLDSGRIRTLNATATAIWTGLDGRSMGDLLRDLIQRFPKRTASQLQQDLHLFLADLVERGLAKVIPSSVV